MDADLALVLHYHFESLGLVAAKSSHSGMAEQSSAFLNQNYTVLLNENFLQTRISDQDWKETNLHVYWLSYLSV